MARLVTEVDEGRHVAAASSRFGEVLDRWLEVKASVVEPTTLASYRWIADTYLVPRLGAVPLDKIRALDLDSFYAGLRKSGGSDGRPLSARTVRYNRRHSAVPIRGHRAAHHGSVDVAGPCSPLRRQRVLDAPDAGRRTSGLAVLAGVMAAGHAAAAVAAGGSRRVS